MRMQAVFPGEKEFLQDKSPKFHDFFSLLFETGFNLKRSSILEFYLVKSVFNQPRPNLKYKPQVLTDIYYIQIAYVCSVGILNLVDGQKN